MKKYFLLTLKAWRLLRPFHCRFYLQAAVIFMIEAVVVFTTVSQGKIFTYIVDKDIQGFLLIIGLLFLVGFVESALGFLRNYNEEKYLGHDIGQYLQQTSLSQILKLTTEQHIEDHSAIKQQVVVRGENAVESIIKTYITGFFPNISYLVIATITLFFYSPLLGALSLSFSLILMLWMNRFLNFFKPLIKQNRDNWTEQGKVRTEAFTHLQLIKSLGRENYFIKKYLAGRARYAQFGKEVDLISVNHRARKAVYSDVTQNITLLIAGILAITGYFTIATLYVVWSITMRAFWAVSSLSNSLRDLPLRYAEVEQYFEAIEKAPSFEESGKKNVSFKDDIRFENVRFTYQKSTHPVFSDLSFVLPNTKTTAFVGSSGSGKSTIIKILLRAYEYQEGAIFVGSTDLRTIDAQHLREHVGYVEQHVDLLDDTIRENILIALPENRRKHGEKRLEEVAVHARIDQFYHRLGEKKFDTVVGERGIKLSGGERQRVGIARAIIKDPEILIFDEATSSLDSENEKYVMEAINDVSKGKTTIIIAHRLSTVKNADKIIVMDKGRVVGEGTHKELMKTSPVYQNLVAHQLS